MKFMLLQNYGGVENKEIGPMSTWTPAEIEAHIAFQVELNKELSERGELVEAQALTAPEQAKFVLHDGRVRRSSPTALSRRARSCSSPWLRRSATITGSLPPAPTCTR